MVVDKVGNLLGRNAVDFGRNIGMKHLEKMVKALRLRLQTKRLVSLHSLEIALRVVIESD